MTNEEGIVLGRLRRDALESDAATPVEEAMEGGPTTFRASVDLEALVERMRERRSGSIVVTDADGRLIGMLYRDEGERVLKEWKEE